MRRKFKALPQWVRESCRTVPIGLVPQWGVAVVTAFGGMADTKLYFWPMQVGGSLIIIGLIFGIHYLTRNK